jgi:hypothetical protein
MKRDHIYSQCGYFLLVGISLINLAFFAPPAAGESAAGLFKAATLSTWEKPLDLPAAWCSFKIILLSLGLFLVIECLGTYLALANRRWLARIIYSLHLLPSLGFLAGGYYFIKALA